MKSNKGFATSFMLFSLLILFLIVISILLFTLSNSSVLNSNIKNKLQGDMENPNSYTEYNFYPTGDVQVFKSLKSRTYTIQAWSTSNNFVSGKIFLKSGQKLYLYVGNSSYNAGNTDIREVYGNINDETSINSKIMNAGYNSSESFVLPEKFSDIKIKDSNNLGEDTNSSGAAHIRIYYYSITANNIGIDQDGTGIEDENIRNKYKSENCKDVQCILDKVAYKIQGKTVINGYEIGSYIQSDGTQYIDTGTKFNTNTDKFELVYQVNDADGNYFIAGSGWQEKGKIWVYSYKNGSTFSLYITDTEGTQRTFAGISGPDTKKHTVKLDAKKLYIDGTLETDNSSYTFGETPYNFSLFNATNTTGYYAKAKIYSFKMWKSGTLTRDMVPCKQLSTGQIGMYDKITNTFFKNSGSGKFTFVK